MSSLNNNKSYDNGSLYKKILNFLGQYKNLKFSTEEIAIKLGLNFYVVSSYLSKYVNAGILIEDSFNLFEFNKSHVNTENDSQFHYGILSIHDKGYGFVISKKTKDKYFVPPNSVNGGINGDLVKFMIFKDELKGKTEEIAKIIEIISRKNDKLVGIVKQSIKSPNELAFIPDRNNISGEIRVKDKSNFILNHKIVLKIKNSRLGYLDCEFYKDLGHINYKYVDIYSIVYEKDIPVEFSEETEKYCNNLKLEDKDLKNRNDLTDQLFVTIDGDDSKDFDDAISVTKLENNKFKLSVAIADVANYVKENTSIDFDALKKGTSVYLIDVVIPMLPYALSNDLCSLNPNTKKLAINVDMIINSEGNVEKYEFTNAVITSKHRLTYGEVNDFFQNNFSYKLKNSQELTDMMKDAHELFLLIKEAKIKKGMIVFDNEESKLKLDKNGKTYLVTFYEHGDAENLIEQFMVCANECAAEFLEGNKNINGLYRVHPAPQSKKTEIFLKISEIFKLNIPEDKKLTNKFFQQIISEVEGSKNKHIINLYLLRSLEKAKYDYKNIGHFGLASKCYTHFTSPIRRYPDLIVHRLIKAILANQYEDNFSQDKSVMEEIANQSNFCESRAVECELDVIKMKKAEFLQNYLKYDFEGIIISITKFGFFVELDNTIEGLVHTSTLVDDFYEFDPEKLQLIGKKTNRTFKLGDNVKITIFNVLKYKGKIDFVLSDLKDKQAVNNSHSNNIKHHNYISFGNKESHNDHNKKLNKNSLSASNNFDKNNKR